MQENIARLNVAHFRVKLATEQDEAKHQILCRLLAEEEAKLAALKKNRGGIAGQCRAPSAATPTRTVDV